MFLLRVIMLLFPSVFLVFLICLLIGSVFLVHQQSCAIIERFGKFHRLAHAGLRFRIPFIDSIKTRISLKIHQLNVEVETKTADNVFVLVVVAVQYKVLEAKIYEAYYVLQNPLEQIKAFVFDLVRAQVPLMNLDDVFSKKDDIADVVKTDLTAPMSDFGYEIIKALVTDIEPDANVKAAMNEINTAQRLRVAAAEKGEAEKILMVKQAEAAAEASALHGKGIANQRQAIIEGLRQSVCSFSEQTGSSVDQIMDLVLMIQYIDALKEIGTGSKSNVVFVPHTPNSIASLGESLRETIFASEMMKRKQEDIKNSSN
jgi:regulator of protease activity HflC (stomatin/prohibitin superfamily)